MAILNNVQQFMLDKKIEYAKECTCERCKEIVVDRENQHSINNLSIQLNEGNKEFILAFIIGLINAQNEES